MRRSAWAAGLIGALAATTAAARGQTVMSWLDPRLVKTRPVTDYRVWSYLDEAGVRDQDASMRYEKHEFSLTMPVYQDDDQQWRLTAQVRALRLETDARLPESGEAFPEQLWDIRLGGGHGRRLAGGQVLGVHATLGAAGDRPFATAGESALSATAFLYWPRGEHAGWLAYATAQSQLDGSSAYAFPGFGYHLDYERFEGLLGLPVVWGKYKPAPSLALQGLLLPSRAMADATWTVAKGFAVFLTYDWEWQRYIRHDRANRDDQLFYVEQRLYAGIDWAIRENVHLLAGAGYGFDRRFFEREGFFSGDERNRFSIGDGAFATVRLRVRF